MKRRAIHLFVLALLALLAVALVALTWREPPADVATPAATSPSALADAIRRDEPVSPLPFAVTTAAPERIALGERLFHETRLSRDGTVSCASCHALGLGGTDRRPVSVGVGGASGQLNTPTIFNVALNFVQFWDGRAASLEAQVAGPLHNPVEMASSWAQAIAALSEAPEYREAFARAYPEGITEGSITDALATFERSLITPNAPFDRYLRGDHGAIDDDARDGYAHFKAYGCASCHQGVGIGGNMFQRFGVMGDYFADRGSVTAADLGRYNVTGRDGDRHVFKVPSLRNVALTAPYFHDGSAETLEEAVEIMARYQLGRAVTAEDRRLIVAFLRTLTGEPPSLQQPRPAS